MADITNEATAAPPLISATFPDLRGRHAIITGASRGIGCGIAEFLGRQGMRLTLAARSEDKGLRVAAGLQAAGVECQWVTADLATPEGAPAVFDAALQRFGRVHLLVNNAAVLHSVGIVDLDEAQYRATFESNMRMLYGISHLVARHMAADGGGGAIVNISSVGGMRVHRDRCGYATAKGAMDAMTKSMAVDLGARGIRVNAVAPGAIGRDPRSDERGQRRDPRAVDQIPLPRLGHALEIGAAVAFLASDAAAYITGQVLYVDGGLTVQLSPPSVRI